MAKLQPFKRPRKAKNGEVKWSWAVRYTGRDQKRHTQHYDSKADADAGALNIENSLRGGTHMAPSRSPTVAVAMRTYLDDRARRVTKPTMNTYESVNRRFITPKLGTLKLSTVTAPLVQQFANDLSADLSATQCRTIMMILGQMLKFAMLNGMVGQNVLKSAPPEMQGWRSKPRAVPTEAEVRTVLEACKRYEERWIKGRFYVLVILAATTGMRPGEVRALRWENIDLREGVVHVVEAMDRYRTVKVTKTDAGDRDIALDPFVVHVLREFKIAQPPNKWGLVFLNRFGTPLGPSSILWQWRKVMASCGFNHPCDPARKTKWYHKYGLPKFQMYALRHYCVSAWHFNGGTDKQLQKMMGHAQIQTTLNVYARALGASAESKKLVEISSRSILPV